MPCTPETAIETFANLLAGINNKMFFASSEFILFQLFPDDSQHTVQASPGLNYLGLQTYDAQRSRYGTEYFIPAFAKCVWKSRSCPILLPNILHRYSATHVQCRNGHVAHGRAHHARHHPGLHLCPGRKWQGKRSFKYYVIKGLGGTVSMVISL